MQPTTKRGRPRKSEALLPGAKKATVATEARIIEIAEKITKDGYGRQAIMKYIKDEWGLSDSQAERYYYSALKYLVPADAEKYREALINRNFCVMESMLQSALERNDLKTALDIVKVMNNLLGVGGKQVEISDKGKDGEEKKIVISFND